MKCAAVKKKFLLANKHITNVRIEELNAQISTLYVENLRLRASEIALATQLKKERERSRMIVVEAEAATHNLMKHLGHIRKSFNVPHRRSTTPEAKPLPELRTRRPPHDVNTSPLVPRLARPPTVPGILEEADEYADGGLDEDEPLSPTPIRRKSKSRPSSELPDRSVPLSLDLPIITFDDQLSQTGKRKPTRRQSGLLTSVSITTVTPKSYSDMLPPRPPSPAFGSPLRMEAALEEEEEALEVIQDARRRGEEEEDAEEPLALTITRRDKRKKSKEKEGTVNCGRELLSESSRRELDKRRSREAEDGAGPLTGKKPKLKDVTNAPPPRPSLANLESALVTSELSCQSHKTNRCIRSRSFSGYRATVLDNFHLLFDWSNVPGDTKPNTQTFTAHTESF
ncbi:hypothetical protein EW026_g4404 [Hermanssonia centrifuga]|uniref:Shugoshin C-terminal domain-containing protein n=1 Tax=Hermanssonia centrifuga TaxID=98765 RepID=A0A4S4KH79_9APHY|nr:hypothetical protein EW026_g4404 [Hermanssonia centrifuga]